MYRPVKRLQTPQNQIINLPLGLGTVEIITRQNQPANILGTRPIKGKWEQIINESINQLEEIIDANNPGTKGKILAPGNGLKPAPRTGQGRPESTLDPDLPGEDPIIYPPGGWQPFSLGFSQCNITIYVAYSRAAIYCISFDYTTDTFIYSPYQGPTISLLPSTNEYQHNEGYVVEQQDFYLDGFQGFRIPTEHRLQQANSTTLIPDNERPLPWEQRFSSYRFDPTSGAGQLVKKPPPLTEEYNFCNDSSYIAEITGKIVPIKITGYSMSCPFPITNPPTIEYLNEPKWPSDIIDPGFPPNWLDDSRECDCMNCGCDCRQIADIMARQLAQIKTNHVETRDKNTRDTEKLAEFLQTQIVQATPTPQEFKPDLSPLLEELKSIKDALKKGCDLEPILRRLNEVEAFLWTGVKPNG